MSHHPGLLYRVLTRLRFILLNISFKLTGINAPLRFLRNPDPWISVRVLRMCGAKIGTGSTVKRSLFIDNAYEDAGSKGDLSNLVIGSNVYIGDMVYLDLANRIEIRDNAILAGQVSVVTHADCNRSEYLNARFPRVSAPVTIGAGCWIGFGATILAGVTIGENSVIGANSLVTGDVEPNSVYYGTPATKQKEI